MIWPILLCILLGYVVGSINPSYIIGMIKGLDIRKKGSGNAGASNAIIVLGAKAGIFSMIFDIVKAFLVVHFSIMIFPMLPLAKELAAVSVILGHVFPFYMKFEGGKGLACLGGAVLSIDWKLFLILLGVELIVLFATNYLFFVPVTASVLFPVAYYIEFGVILHQPYVAPGTMVLLVGGAVIIFKHRKNILKMIRGQEMHFSYVYSKSEKKEAELNRVKAGIEKYGKVE